MSWAESPNKLPSSAKHFSTACPRRLGAPARHPMTARQRQPPRHGFQLQRSSKKVYLGMLQKTRPRRPTRKPSPRPVGVASLRCQRKFATDATPFEQVYVAPRRRGCRPRLGPPIKSWSPDSSAATLLRYESTPIVAPPIRPKKSAPPTASAVSASATTIAELSRKKNSCAAPPPSARRKNPRRVSRPRLWGPRALGKPQHQITAPTAPPPR